MWRTSSPLFTHFLLAGSLCLGGLFVAPQARAAETTPQRAGAKPAASAAKQIPKDVENRRGISPFWEQIVLGDRAAMSHDFTSAHHYYRTALTSDPKNPIGHLRLAEVALRKNELDAAPDYLEAALRFSEGDLRSLSKAHFLMAQYYERKNSIDAAIAAWTTYKSLAVQAQVAENKAETPAPAQANNALVSGVEQRIQVLTARKEQLAAYEEVRKRIESNVAAADQVTGKAASSSSAP